MPTSTTGSFNIATLDSKIIADLCAGIFYIDVTPSVYIGSGADNVLGAGVRVTNPYGVVIKEVPTSGYDIYPPMTDVVSVSVPTQASNFQYGKYTVDVILTDADGTTFTVSKVVSICAPNPLDKTKQYGSLSAQLNGVCKDGKVYISADTVPTYNGAISDSQVNAFTLEYPTSSGLAVLSTTNGSFSTVLFEGVYKFTGTICASYSFGDNVFVKVNYKVKREKNIRCLLDETCIYAKLAQLDAQTKSDCTDAEKTDTQNIIIGALRLIKTIEVSTNAGFDAGDYIDELETLLGCVCTCNCADGTPIINTSPAKDFLISGCNVVKTTVGLTDTYVIDNFSYDVAVTENGGAITVSAPVLSGCNKRQTFTFSIATVYTQIKNQIVNLTEYNFWASIINKSWDSLDVTCLGTPAAWSGWTYTERTQWIISNICSGGSCFAEISTNATSSSAADVEVTWTNVESVYEVAAYLDGVLAGTILAPAEDFTFVGAADGTAHEYKLISKCSNGSIGNLLDGTFNYYGCPTIALPTVSLTNISGATCPYDLSALVSGLPFGITAEWHNLNNTHNSSLVVDPTNAQDGTFYVFAKNSDGCYSLGVQVILSCSAATSCTAPQTLIVETVGGGSRVRFQSAAFPPPSNSYTVKRRLTADPDVDGSYTTIGTPTWNSSVNRWEILDTTETDNTLYTYRAISNCTSNAPYIDYIFANLTCPVVTLTPAENSMDYSFTGAGGDVDKYEVKIYDSSGVTLIHTDTKLPVFSSPITGTFTYLDGGTVYKVRLRSYIGTYYKDCTFTSGTTTGDTGLSAFLTRSGSAGSGTLNVVITGGTAPYDYVFSCNAVGACEAHMIDSPTGTTSDSASTTYSVTLYAVTTYQFYVTVTDFLGAITVSNFVTNPPCLVPETMISMKDGSQKQLGELKVGDELFDNNKVESFERRTVDKLYIINGGLLKASEGHVHILANGDLVQSLDLKKGDLLQGRNGRGVTPVTSIEVSEGEFEVINIETATKNYIANGILTHNKLACP